MNSENKTTLLGLSIVLILIANFLVMACAPTTEAESEERGFAPILKLKKNSTDVFDIRLPDGTRCVIVDKWRYDGGVAITCDFR